MVTMQNNDSHWLEERINLLERDEIENMSELICMSHDSAVINRCWYIAMVDHVLIPVQEVREQQFNQCGRQLLSPHLEYYMIKHVQMKLYIVRQRSC